MLASFCLLRSLPKALVPDSADTQQTLWRTAKMTWGGGGGGGKNDTCRGMLQSDVSSQLPHSCKGVSVLQRVMAQFTMCLVWQKLLFVVGSPHIPVIRQATGKSKEVLWSGHPLAVQRSPVCGDDGSPQTYNAFCFMSQGNTL